MFSSKKAVFDISQVPPAWIYEYYLKLPNTLNGQDIKIKSAFNPNDNNPSMFIYYNSATKNYRFKCFSTGKFGDGVQMVMYMKDILYVEAIKMIMSDYVKFLESNTYTTEEIVPEEKWKVTEYAKRQWNKDDADYWTPYNIGSKLLNHYNVIPLQSFTMSRSDESFTRSGKRLYGYFSKTGNLLRIYMPGGGRKFLIVESQIQGWDQIRKKSRLFICSSLKDIMSMRSLNFDGDYIAPNSENSYIDPIMNWINTYDEKYVIFDNDIAGIKMMNTYKEKYGIPFLHINLSKDISDSVRDHGSQVVKDYMTRLL